MNVMLVLGMFPGFLSMTAVYFVLKEINLTQNLLGLILVYSASSAMQYYICKGFFDTISKSLDEAARIDGASRHTVFIKIILPLAKPIIIYTVLSAFIAPWGEYMFSSFIMLGDPDQFTVAVGMKSWLDNSSLMSGILCGCGRGFHPDNRSVYMVAAVLCGRDHGRLGKRLRRLKWQTLH